MTCPDVFATRLIGGCTIAIAAACATTPPASVSPRVSAPLSIEVHEGTKLGFDISADGRTIVFDLLGQLWTLPATGGSARPLTHAVRDTSEDLQPAIAPDGNQIAFRADRPGGGGIFLGSTEHDSVRRIASDARDGPVGPPAWAPDGKRLAFVRGSNPTRLEIFDVTSGNTRAIEVRGLPQQNREITAPSWSPDGSHIVFVNASSFQRRGGRIWEVPADGGDARPWAMQGVDGLGPRYSPDGRQLAFFTPDSSGRLQVAVARRDEPSRLLTSLEDVTPRAVRWERGGSLVLHANGRLWRVSSNGGAPAEIPFTARLELARRPARLAAVRFPRGGTVIQARGFMGLALSPSGGRIALIALDTLWVFRPGEQPRPVTAVPATAAGLSWSPDETEVTWSAGPGGGEDIFATRLADGMTRTVAALPGGETRPSWSPDGHHIAFVHGRNRDFRLLVVPGSGPTTSHPDSTLKLGLTSPPWGFFAPPQEEPAWTPDGRGILLGSVIRLLGGDSLRLDVADTGKDPAFVSWPHDSSIYFVNDELLWRRRFRQATRSLGPAERIADDPAMYPSVARDGSVLYVSTDGLRLSRPGRRTQRLGWPLTRRVGSPAPLFISRGRLIQGVADSATAAVDILVRGGRIERIAPAGAMAPPHDAQIVDADGNWVMPGLIDLHGHLWDDALLPGMLYFGVTTVRDMGATGIARLSAHRDAFELNVRPGPRIVFGGVQFWGSSGGLSAPGAHAPTDDAARARAIAMLRAFGAEYLKMRWFGDWTGASKLIAAAHDAGWAVSGHEAVPLPLVAAGIDGQEHFGPSGARTDQAIYLDIVELYRSAGIWVVPTIVGYSSVPRVMSDTSVLSRDESAAFITPFLKFWQTRLSPNAPASYARFAEVTRAATRRVRAGGVTIGAGSDAALPWGLHWELEELVSAGLTPREAIHAATGAAARILGAEGEIGSISPGAWADLVILTANPLEDIRNTRKISAVIRGGRVVDRAALLRQRGMRRQ